MARTGRKFGWHSGTLFARDGRFTGDLYVQDDIIFSDVSAGVLGITGGIDMQDTISAIGIDMGGTFSTCAINIDGTTPIGINIAMTDAVGGYEGILITNSFTKIGAVAHKAISVILTYEPATAGTACPVGVASKVVLDGDLTRANNYQGYGWGVQGQIDITDGTTIADNGDYDPGAVYAALRGVVTGTGTGNTFTDGTITSLYAENQLKQDASSGTFRVFLAWLRFQGTTASVCNVDAGLYIDSGNAWGNNITVGVDINDSVTGIDIGTCTTGINVTGACTTAINISVIQTADGGLDETAVFRHGTWSTPLVYGTLTGHTVLKSVSITGAATGVYLMGDLFKLTTTATSTGTLVGHYNYITVAHTTASTYNYYGRLVISTDATITNAECMLLTVDVSSGVTLGTTGHLSGLHVAMTIDSGATDIATAVETCGVYVQTSGMAKDVTGPTVGIKVEDSGVTYLDYGLQFSNCFVNATALIHMDMTQGTTTAAGILFENNNSHVLTSAFKFKDNASGQVTYLCDFTNTDGAEDSVYEKDANAANGIHGKIMILNSDGAKGYINVYSTAN